MQKWAPRMRRRLGTVLFLVALGSAWSAALAQRGPSEPPAHASAPHEVAGDGATVVLERPSEGPRRGLVSTSPAVVYGLVALALAVSLAALTRRLKP
jgi:hypothetical protein